MATKIDPVELLVQTNSFRRDPRAIEGIFRKPSELKNVYIPAGEYELTEPLVLNDPVIVEGEGPGVSVLIYNGEWPAITFLYEGNSKRSGVQNVKITTTSPQNNTSGLCVSGANNFFIQNVEFSGFNQPNGLGLFICDNSSNVSISESDFRNNDLGIEISSTSTCKISNISLDNLSGNLFIHDSSHVSWKDGINQGSPTEYGIKIRDGYTISLENISHNLTRANVFAVETAGTQNRMFSLENCSFEISNSPQKLVKFDGVDTAYLSNNYANLSSSDTGLELANSRNITIKPQDTFYRGSPYISNTDDSGVIWLLGEAEGSNSGTVDYDNSVSQAVWYVDPVNGDDGYAGDTSSTALKTFAEFQDRTSANTLQQQTTIYLLNDCDQIVALTGAWPDGLWIWGQPTEEIATGTLTGAQAYSSPSTLGYLEDTSVSDWSSYQYKMIEITSGSANGAKAYIVEDLGSGQVRTSPLYNSSAFAIQTPSAGDTYRIVSVPRMKVVRQNGIGNFGLIGIEVIGNPDTFDAMVETEGSLTFYEHCLFGTEHFWHYTGQLLIDGCHSKLTGTTHQVYSGTLAMSASSWEGVIRTTVPGAMISLRNDNYFFGGGKLDLREGGTVRMINNSSAIFIDKTTGDCFDLEKNGLLDIGTGVEIWGNSVTGDGLIATRGCSVEWPSGTDFDSIFLLSVSGDEVNFGGDSIAFSDVGSYGRLDAAPSWERFLNVKRFGATGDGVTDDTVAIQAAIDYAIISNHYNVVWFPRGNYNITSSLIVS